MPVWLGVTLGSGRIHEGRITYEVTVEGVAVALP